MRTKSPFADAIKALEARVTRLEALGEGFLRHAHVDTPTGENAVKASVEAEESVRHDG